MPRPPRTGTSRRATTAAHGVRPRPRRRARARAPAARSRADVVALVTSAGGLHALTTVLQGLPHDFPLPVLVVMHLPPKGSALVELLSRRVTLAVAWAENGEPLAAGEVRVCPPGMSLEVLPDGTCSVGPADRAGLDKPFDFFLRSLADSFGARAVAVVLTGMGTDGAEGVRHLRKSGATVIVQSEASAEFPAMPAAARRTGAADAVLPLEQIPKVLETVVSGAPARDEAETEAVNTVFGGPGDARTQLRTVDWAATTLGLVRCWPESLRTTVVTVLASRCRCARSGDPTT